MGSTNVVVGNKRKKSHKLDMINSPIPFNMLLFSLPIAASSILQQLFNSADVAVVGRFAGRDALAAVSGNAPVVALFVNVLSGLSIGVNVQIAHYVGQKQNKGIHKCVHTSLLFAVFCGIFVMLAGLLLSHRILMAIDTPKEVFDQALLYLRIYLIGMPFIIVYNFGAAILRAVGDTRRPLFCLLISGALNVLLNLLFVIIFDMGVSGVAAATVISNVVSMFIVLGLLMREEESLRLNVRELSIDGKSLLGILRIGVPSAAQTAVFSLSNILIQGGINSFGRDAIAGSGVAVNFEYFAYFVIAAFAQGSVTFVSQNYGAGEYERCRKSLRTAMLEGMLITAVFSALMMTFAIPLTSLYTTKKSVIRYAITRMNHIMLFEFMTGTYEITAAALRGMGKSLLPSLITVVGSVVFRIIWLYTVFETYHTYSVLLRVYIVSWIITGTAMIAAYIIVSKKTLGVSVGRWKKKREHILQ